MKRRNAEDPQPPTKEQVQNLLSLIRDQRLQATISTLMETPEEWDSAMLDPSNWLRARGVELPDGLTAAITKEISHSKPLDPAIVGKPGPDWIPYEIKFTNCRTYWIATRDEDGKITGFRQETICFGLEIVLNPLPGWPGPSPL